MNAAFSKKKKQISVLQNIIKPGHATDDLFWNISLVGYISDKATREKFIPRLARQWILKQYKEVISQER